MYLFFPNIYQMLFGPFSIDPRAQISPDKKDARSDHN